MPSNKILQSIKKNKSRIVTMICSLDAVSSLRKLINAETKKETKKSSKKKETKNKKGALRLLIINLAAMAAVVIAAIFFTFSWIDNYTEHGIAIKVVDVTGMQEEEAIQALSKHDLMGITSDHIFVKGVLAG